MFLRMSRARSSLTGGEFKAHGGRVKYRSEEADGGAQLHKYPDMKRPDLCAQHIRHPRPPDGHSRAPGQLDQPAPFPARLVRMLALAINRSLGNDTPDSRGN
jgi:hypothetical protein